MTTDPVELDVHRGMAAQKATVDRRHTAEVEADRAMLRRHQDEMEEALCAGPAATWEEAGKKALYLITLFAGPRRGTIRGTGNSSRVPWRTSGACPAILGRKGGRRAAAGPDPGGSPAGQVPAGPSRSSLFRAVASQGSRTTRLRSDHGTPSGALAS